MHFHLLTHETMLDALFHAERLSMHTPTWHAVRIYLDHVPVVEVNNGETQAGLFYWQEVNSFLEGNNN